MNRSSSTLFVRLPAPPATAPAADAAAPLCRAPLFERLLAGADAHRTVLDWRREAFAGIAAGGEAYPGPCAAALYRACGAVDAAAAFLATPVEYRPTMSSVQLAPGGVLRLDGAQASQLAQDFNRIFAGGEQRLAASAEGALFCLFDRAVAASTHDPWEAQGLDIGAFQAAGADGPRLRRLMSEMEMWLFEHAVNRERARRGQAALGGLWLWGGCAPPPRPPRLTGWAAGADVLFGALDRQTEFPRDGRSGVVVLDAPPGSAAWRGAEERWILPAIEALGAGTLGRIAVSAGRRLAGIRAGHRLRFWRRRRPWWESFQ